MRKRLITHVWIGRDRPVFDIRVPSNLVLQVIAAVMVIIIRVDADEAIPASRIESATIGRARILLMGRGEINLTSILSVQADKTAMVNLRGLELST